MSVRLNDLLFPYPIIRNHEAGIVASSLPLDFIDEDPDPDTVNQAAFICTIPKDGDLNGLKIGVGDVADGVELSVRIETVDPATGEPTGTLLDAGLTVSEVTGELLGPSVWEAAFAAPVTVAAGTVVAIRLSSDGIDTDVLLFTGLQRAFPYVRTFDGTDWTQVEGIIPVAFSYEAVEGERAVVTTPGGFPVKEVQDAGAVFASLPAGSRFGFFLTPPYTMTVAGIWMIAKLAAEAAIRFDLWEAIEIEAPLDTPSMDYKLTLKPIANKTFNEEQTVQPSGEDARALMQGLFDESHRLIPTKTYFLEISGTFSGLNMNVYTDLMVGSADVDQFSLLASWLTTGFTFINGFGAASQLGRLPDYGLILRSASIRTATGGGVPPGVLSDLNLVKAEMLKDFIDVEENQ